MPKIFSVETVKDLELTKELFTEYADSLDFDLDFQDFERELANLPGDYAPPKGCLILAKHNGQVAGCVALRQLEESICEMKRLYVRPEFRCLVIGIALAQFIVEQTRMIGYICISLDRLLQCKRRWHCTCL